MGFYKHLKGTFIQEYKQRSQLYRERLVRWNAEGPVVRVDKPTNIARARELGYKAKQGVIIVRVSIKGGRKKRKKFAGGRKPSKSGRFFSRAKSLQAIAEERAANRFSNCEVLNSYFVGQSGSITFFEVILLDRTSNVIKSDHFYRNVIAQKGRAFRGMSSSGRKHRGLMRKGFGTNMSRPSRRANFRRMA